MPHISEREVEVRIKLPISFGSGTSALRGAEDAVLDSRSMPEDAKDEAGDDAPVADSGSGVEADGSPDPVSL